MRDFVLSDEVKVRKALATKNARTARKISIIVKNIETNEETIYNSLTDVGKALHVSKSAVSQALLSKRLLKKRYAIMKVIKT
jgi:hypothetical protein